MNYKITRFEQKGDELFICINHTEKPVYIEHFFTEEEKQNVEKTIAKLIAELMLKAEEYIETPQVISLLDEVKDLKIDENEIISLKEKIIQEKNNVVKEKNGVVEGDNK